MSYEQDFVKVYDAFVDPDELERRADALSAFLREHDAHTVLDVGCGTGLLAGLLSQRGFAVRGVDLSEHMIAAAQQNHPGVDFVVADAQEMSVGVFDAVIATDSVLTFLSEQVAFERAVSNLCSHVADAGVLYFDLAFTEQLCAGSLADSSVHVSGEDYELRKSAKLRRAGDTVVSDIRIEGLFQGARVDVHERHEHRVVSQERVGELLESQGFEVSVRGNQRSPWRNLEVFAVKRP